MNHIRSRATLFLLAISILANIIQAIDRGSLSQRIANADQALNKAHANLLDLTARYDRVANQQSRDAGLDRREQTDLLRDIRDQGR